ncbi:hypothetical protein [Xanthomarina gelatinilytica]|uniref:hypothetical protein n=1 Tax=Xanthomarina gelatinilytica TaxID=1137281 RepID=UPI003AA7FAA7
MNLSRNIEQWWAGSPITGNSVKNGRHCWNISLGAFQWQWGFDPIITKKNLESASADYGLIALAYNLKRMLKLGARLAERYFAAFMGLGGAIPFTITPENGFWSKGQF